MGSDEPVPPKNPTREEASDSDTVRERIRKILAGVSEPTTVSTVAEMANCSTQGARDALREFEQMGLVIRETDDPLRYRKNPAYFQFLRAHRRARESSADELREQFRQLFDEYLDYVARFDEPTPESVSGEAVFESTGEEGLEALRDWERLLAELRDVREAYGQLRDTRLPRPRTVAVSRDETTTAESGLSPTDTGSAEETDWDGLTVAAEMMRANARLLAELPEVDGTEMITVAERIAELTEDLAVEPAG
ncbi:MAG: hypothetical protein ABEI75_03210 [Halobaculum sp.]